MQFVDGDKVCVDGDKVCVDDDKVCVDGDKVCEDGEWGHTFAWGSRRWMSLGMQEEWYAVGQRMHLTISTPSPDFRHTAQ